MSSAFARDGFGIAAHDVGTGVVSPRIVERVGVDSTRAGPDRRPSLGQLEPCWPRGGSVCSRLTFDDRRRRPLSLSQFLGDPLGLQTRLPPARLRRRTPLAQLLLVTCTGAIRKRLLRRRWLAECPSGGIATVDIVQWAALKKRWRGNLTHRNPTRQNIAQKSATKVRLFFDCIFTDFACRRLRGCSNPSQNEGAQHEQQVETALLPKMRSSTSMLATRATLIP